MVCTKGELELPEYETSFLIKCLKQINSYFEDTDGRTLALLMKDEDQETIQRNLVEGYLAAIDDMVKVRKYNHKKKYCINIKVHSLPLTPKERNYIYENWEKTMDFFWERIRFWIDSRRNQPNIYSYGRSSGWLGLDRKVIERSRGYQLELERVKGAFEDVKGFREGWDSLFEEMRARLDEMIS